MVLTDRRKGSVEWQDVKLHSGWPMRENDVFVDEVK